MYSAYQAVKRGIHEPKYDEVQKQVGAKGKRETEEKMETLGSLPVSVRCDRRVNCRRILALQKTAMSSRTKGNGLDDGTDW